MAAMDSGLEDLLKELGMAMPPRDRRSEPTEEPVTLNVTYTFELATGHTIVTDVLKMNFSEEAAKEPAKEAICRIANMVSHEGWACFTVGRTETALNSDHVISISVSVEPLKTASENDEWQSQWDDTTDDVES